MMQAARRRATLRTDIWALFLLMLAVFCAPAASAQELLLNRSFETQAVGGAVPVNGNNFYATLPNWTLVESPVVNSVPVNLVKPFNGYNPGGPGATPTGGGLLYLDINSTGGVVSQQFTVPQNGNIDFSAWISVRDFQQALTTVIAVRNSAGAIVSSVAVNHLASDPINATGTWRQGLVTNFPVSAGTYTFEIQMDNFANADLTSVIFKPALTMTKSRAIISDPFNNAVLPKSIPGAFVDYTLGVSNPAAVAGPPAVPGYLVASNSVVVSDATPAGLSLFVGNLGGSPAGPVTYTAGTSGMTFSFVSLASLTDDVEFSSNNGATWTYVPVPNAFNVDPLVTNVRMNPKNSMPSGSAISFKLRYRVN
jgi:hypothetical protein